MRIGERVIPRRSVHKPEGDASLDLQKYQSLESSLYNYHIVFDGPRSARVLNGYIPYIKFPSAVHAFRRIRDRSVRWTFILIIKIVCLSSSGL